ncbi:hypothetical protein OG901_16535 [Streptomyces mirabilis]|uniref:hypothetical protein n=1 Tax=Streptomyces mirabilis TaxID=68239 RepID=UPI002258D3C4|nr:hypothetical protein [Streptomyces mirabilis]MCX5349359.1 hypothetical protein [Streptomyces mirabilis]
MSVVIHRFVCTANVARVRKGPNPLSGQGQRRFTDQDGCTEARLHGDRTDRPHGQGVGPQNQPSRTALNAFGITVDGRLFTLRQETTLVTLFV